MNVRGRMMPQFHLRNSRKDSEKFVLEKACLRCPRKSINSIASYLQRFFVKQVLMMWFLRRDFVILLGGSALLIGTTAAKVSLGESKTYYHKSTCDFGPYSLIPRFFHGFLSAKKATSQLQTSYDTKKQQYYVVRFSEVEVGGFYLTFTEEDGKVTHERISNRKGFSFCTDRD